MARYVLAYHGGGASAGSDRATQQRNAFTEWIRELGDAVIDPGTPLTHSKTVSSSGVFDTAESNRLTGFSVIQATSIEEAIEFARDCPFLQVGTIELAEVMEM